MPNPFASPTITLLTDFGTRDHYVGVLKGVIGGICPAARIVDISHEVEPFQVAQGGYLLAQAWPWFPAGTIHVAVVDPGVGSARRTLAAEGGGHRFILPDNGLLSSLAIPTPEVREIQNPGLFLHPVSHTFHGRDIFAPAAAHLACGFPFGETGPLVSDWVQFAQSAAAVLHIDRFGNIITGLRAADHALATETGWALRIGASLITRFASNYAAAPRGELFVIEGSGGYLEISTREASAGALVGCRVGDPVTLVLDGKS